MSLLAEKMTACVLLTPTLTEDGYGGRVETYENSTPFMAAIVFNGSVQAKRGSSNDVQNAYSVITQRAVVLDYHDVFMRISDSKIFRVTSDGEDNMTPDSASLNMRKVEAEEWGLPNG